MGESMVGNGGFEGKFDNPVLLPSSMYLPTSLGAALDWCRYYYFKIPNYRQVQKRVVRWFITDFEFPATVDEKEKESMSSYLKDILDLPMKMIEMGDNWGCYGNAFIRFHYGFTRWLKDERGPETKFYSLNQFDQSKIKFNLKDLTYTVPDPTNNYNSVISLPFEDIKDRDRNALKLIIMDPRYIRIVYNELADAVKYVYKFNPYTVSRIKDNNLLVINTTPKYMLEAIAKGYDIIFKEGEVFHFRSPIIAGISHSDWGLSELMANFGQIYQIMLYLKADEAIARDFITPFRIFSPPPSGGSQNDFLQTTDGALFQQSMSEVISNRRKDPSSIHALPFSVQLQEVGASGKQFTPKDLLEYQNDQLLNGCGFPVELYKLSLQTNQIPTALRVFQNSFYFIYNNYNKFVKWVVKKVLDYTKSEQMEVRLQEPQMADNLENINLLSQLVTGGVLPYDAIFKRFGITKPVDEIVKRRKQDMEVDQKSQEAEEEMQRKQQAQDLLQQNSDTGGSDMSGLAPGGQMPVMDKYTQAANLAQTWLQLPIGQRRQQMMTTEQQDIELYALAKQIMEQQRNQMRSEGVQMLKDQNGYI
jgi:hypothetical protein